MQTTSIKHYLSGLVAFARETAGVSKKEMAERLDITPQNLWNIENGYQNITCEYLEKITQKLNMSQKEFLLLIPKYIQHVETINNKPQTQNNKP